MSVKNVKGSASVAENKALAKAGKGFPFKKIAFALLIVLIVISFFLLVVNIVINSYFSKVTVFDGVWEIDQNKLNSNDMYKDNVAYFSKTEELHQAYHAALLAYAQASSDVKYSEDVFNYAIFGTDQFAGSEMDSSADVIMLVSVDDKNDNVTYLSFEARMLVYIPAVGVGPLSDAYWLGGPQLLVNTIELNYGIHLDGFVELNMSAFVELIDEYGPIEFSGDKALVEKINNDIAEFNVAKALSGDDAVNKVTLKNGKVTMNGQQTLAYMRNAGRAKSDITNNVLSQITSKIYEDGFVGVKTTLDIALEKMTVSLLREDVGALIEIGLSVFETIEAVPVGNTGITPVSNINVYVCDYQTERAGIVSALYE